jgi:hypothetical protein
MMERIEKDFSDDIKIVKTFQYSFKKPWEHAHKFGDDTILLITPEEQTERTPVPTDLVPIPASEWDVSTNINPHLLPLLKDGKMETRWSTDRFKSTGDHLLLELDRPLDGVVISLFMGPSANDFATDLQVEISPDGSRWELIENGYLMSDFLERQFKTPADIVQKIQITEKDIKFIKLTQIGNSLKFWWSIAELEIARADKKEPCDPDV